MPNATASNVSGAEDAVIALTGLSASLVDTDGSEVLSVKIIGIPTDSILSAGSNNGDGSWTVPAAALSTLTIRPPKDYSGVMNLAIEAYALDANGSTATRNVPFTVTVTPAADGASINPQAIAVNENTPQLLNLENPAEQVEITLSNLLAGASITATGGTLIQLNATEWRFTGTKAQADTLSYIAGDNSGMDTVNVSVVTIDGASRSSAITGAFDATITGQADAPALFTANAAGPTATTIPLNIASALTDIDGSETLSLTLSGVPAGVTFSAGTNAGGGVWSFTPAQLANLTMTTGLGQSSFSLGVAAVSTETANGNTATTSGAINVMMGTAGAAISGDGGPNSLRGADNNDTIDGGSGNDTLNGGAGADSVLGGVGDDRIIGGLGADILSGGTGADRFVWQSGDATTGPDTISDFAVGQNDALDIAAILTGYGGGPLTGFVQLTEAGGNTTVRIDSAGGGNYTTAIAILTGVTGLNVEIMRTNGNLIA
jgi:large repetitive protein